MVQARTAAAAGGGKYSSAVTLACNCQKVIAADTSIFLMPPSTPVSRGAWGVQGGLQAAVISQYTHVYQYATVQ